MGFETSAGDDCDRFLVPPLSVYPVAHNLCCTLAGNGFCFPKYRAAIVEKPSFQCGYQYTLNHTKLGAACVRRTYTKMNTCFKSVRCPINGNYSQTDEIWWVKHASSWVACLDSCEQPAGNQMQRSLSPSCQLGTSFVEHHRNRVQ